MSDVVADAVRRRLADEEEEEEEEDDKRVGTAHAGRLVPLHQLRVGAVLHSWPFLALQISPQLNAA